MLKEGPEKCLWKWLQFFWEIHWQILLFSCGTNRQTNLFAWQVSFPMKCISHSLTFIHSAHYNTTMQRQDVETSLTGTSLRALILILAEHALQVFPLAGENLSLPPGLLVCIVCQLKMVSLLAAANYSLTGLWAFSFALFIIKKMQHGCAVLRLCNTFNLWWNLCASGLIASKLFTQHLLLWTFFCTVDVHFCDVRLFLVLWHLSSLCLCVQPAWSLQLLREHSSLPPPLSHLSPVIQLQQWLFQHFIRRVKRTYKHTHFNKG